MSFLKDDKTYRKRPINRRKLGPWLIIGGSLLFLTLAISAPLWLRFAIRTFIPDRYAAAYLPEPLYEMVFDTDPFETLPTAVPADASAEAALLEQLSAIEQPQTTPLPTISVDVPSISPSDEILTPAFEAEELPPIPSEEDTEAALNEPDSVMLQPFDHNYQMWNNCGPATLATYLSYWELGVTQEDIQQFVKPNIEDRNVRPDELQAYVESLGYNMIVRVDGDLDLIQRLIDAGYPVMIEKGFDPEPDRLGWMGHYLLIYGYSKTDRTFWTMDSYLGPGQQEPYDYINRMWQHFNRTYLVVYPPDQYAEVAAIIGQDIDTQTMYTGALATAQIEAQADPDNPYAWFNIGSSLVALGDSANAASAFDIARSKGTPWRMLWYQFGPYEAYLNVGGDRLNDVITLADTVLANNEYSEEAYYYKGRALEAMGYHDEAIECYEKASTLNPHFELAEIALAEQ
ncbi:MAG: C39 family peptidase [Anaerolineae bacterium]|nr:C39 family peptidase [Anaerolineae bacterium]